ncbi:probable cytochrome P450 304a1 isoform X1 [Bombus vosnesenskii]|uniref:Probable cytochrome P450 304a1 isoform X1 n=1 Tax=Bombus vosnesenskii TaxID=207650 RepID=A0A6J3KMF0_9HYME|nr:probable cytochrome P450 304a1 isoform X1 [Bombus vosnesenskii]
MSPFLVIILVLLVGYKIYKSIRTLPNTPPCIPRLPIVGSYWYLLWYNYKYPFKAVTYYANKLKSKVLTCHFGGIVTVVANDYNSIKEVLTKDDFDGRAGNIDVLLARSFGESLGIFFVEGLFWQEQRRFVLRHMRDFGFGRRQEKFETIAMEEIAILIDMLKEGPINDKEKTILKSGSARFPDILYPYVANTIWYIMFGEKFDRSEYHKLRYFCESAMMFQRAFDTTGGALSQFWFLKYFGNMFGYKNIMLGTYRMVDFIKEHLDKRKYSDNEDDKGLIDRYLKVLNGNAKGKSFSEKQLIMILVDIMFPASSAVPSALLHTIKLIMHHPEVIKNIREEIDKVVGTGRLITWQDRKNLPYIEATIRESLRYETLTPFSVLHKAIKRTTLSGFDVAKDTIVITNLDGLNTDVDLWGDPHNFRPERFLTEDGKLRKDLTFPFGFGRRVCVGETFTRYNMFGIIAVLMQNFNFSFIEDEPNSLKDKMPGLIVSPKEMWIRVEPRYT